jgi:D-3-phosphoglycerate dehydrogenase / 2-oxoglutarate reductase
VKVLITEALAPAAAERLRAAGHEVIERHGVQAAELVAALKGCQALLVRGATKVTGEVLRASSGLRVVARAGTGVDNIDVATAKDRGVLVLNAPAANAISVAELTLGLLLALERHLVDAGIEMRAGKWEKSKHMGRELNGRTIGLVGFGRIGRDVATRARAFGMSVIASDPLLSQWPAEFGWVERVTLEELLPRADYVSLHLPLTPETRGMIGAPEMKRMKPSAVLVNCARGGTVDETALIEALRAGTLRGAALDVFATEPAPAEHPLRTLPNVIVTPHLGASTHEAQERAGVEAAERVIAALREPAVSSPRVH